MICVYNIIYIIGFWIVDYVDPGEKIYHKYDMIVYPKKTQISKSMREKLSKYATKLKGWVTQKNKTSGSNEVEEFVPMNISEMSGFCLQSYLEEYKIIVCEGNFQQGSNVIKIVDSIIYVFNSLASFAVHTHGFFSRTITVEVSDKNIYKEVCETQSIFYNIYYDNMILCSK